MTKQHFFCRLIPPRPTFAYDMNDNERTLMMEHAAYMNGFFEQGSVLAYGPVFDPEGAFGFALLEVEDHPEAERLLAGDPTVRAGLNRFTISPMRIGGAQGSRVPMDRG